MWLANGLSAQSCPAAPLSTAGDAAARYDGPYYYRGRPYGHEAVAGPFDLFLNKSFATAWTEKKSRRIFDFPYGWSAVGDALRRPFAAIERGEGLGEFLTTQILPFEIDSDAAWYTHYLGHIIEGGIHSRRMREWLVARGVPAAGLLAGLATMASSVLNEAYEVSDMTVGSASTVADLYVFDPIGILLFVNDDVARFFACTVGFNVWVGQPSIMTSTGELRNNSNFLVLKPRWEVIPRVSPFFWTGIGVQAGATFHADHGYDVSLGIGTDTRRIISNRFTGNERVLVDFSTGIFVDREGSLLATLYFSKIGDRMLTANVYPGVVKLAGGTFGAWAQLTEDKRFRFGISNRYGWGAGLGFGR